MLSRARSLLRGPLLRGSLPGPSLARPARSHSSHSSYDPPPHLSAGRNRPGKRRPEHEPSDAVRPPKEQAFRQGRVPYRRPEHDGRRDHADHAEHRRHSPRTGTLAAVRPPTLAVSPSAAERLMLADEAGDLHLGRGADPRVREPVPVLEYRREQSMRDRAAERPVRAEWGQAWTWRDWDTSCLPPLNDTDVKFRPLPADFENTIAAANSRRSYAEKVSVRYPLFMGMSIPATHVQGGGAPAPPPFPPPEKFSERGWAYPDGLPASSDERAHRARRSADARAGSGFVFPVPGSARVFALVPKARVSRLCVERRRCRNRFFAAWRHVTNRTEGVPPLSHTRVYSFVINAAMYDAPFLEICETVERAIRELDRKLQPTKRGQARWTARQ